MTERRKYKKAFKVACELLNGAILYGYDSDCIFSEMMKKDGGIFNCTGKRKSYQAY